MKSKRAFIFVALISILVLAGTAAFLVQKLAVPLWIVIVSISFIVVVAIIEDMRRPEHKEYYHDAYLRPRIPSEYLQSKPVSNAMIFGKDFYTGKYVCKPPDMVRSSLVIGGSGSGKTSCMLIPSVLSCTSGSKMILDIKGRELTLKTANIKDPGTFIVDLNKQNEFIYGWDVFYKLHQSKGKPNEADVLAVLTEIAPIVIPEPQGGADPGAGYKGRHDN